MSARATRGALTVAVLLALTAGCGTGSSSGGTTRPSLTASLSPTRSLPTVSRPTGAEPTRPTASEGPTSAPPTSEPTTKPTTKPTSSAPSSGPTTGPTQGRPTSGPPSQSPTEAASSEVTESAVTEPSESAAPVVPDDSTGDGSSTAWWWLVLLALVVAAVVTVLLVRRSRSRQAWTADLDGAEQEIAWFGRDLLPALRSSGSFAGVSGGWAVAAPRAQALEDRLTRLVTTAPDDDRRARATASQNAVRTARERMAALLVAGETAQWSLALDDVQAPLLAVLVPAGPAGPAGPEAAG